LVQFTQIMKNDVWDFSEKEISLRAAMLKIYISNLPSQGKVQ